MKKLIALLLSLTMVVSMTACGSSEVSAAASSKAASEHQSTTAAETAASGAESAAIPGLEDGVFTVAMECAYAPYNWSQTDDSNGAVPIKDSNEYANGYDIMIAKKICEANGWQLEVIRSDWDSLVPAVQTGTIDAAIAGQSMTAERAEQVDFAGPYFYATIVCVTKSDSKYARRRSPPSGMISACPRSRMPTFSPLLRRRLLCSWRWRAIR